MWFSKISSNHNVTTICTNYQLLCRKEEIMRTYEQFSGDELIIAEKIQRRRLQLLVHSCIYYELDKNLISDRQWDEWARELVKLQAENPYISSQVIWAEAFEGWDASTGAFLPLKDDWVMRKAIQLAGKPKHREAKPASKPIKKKATGMLF